jgi:hypothetical protein
MIDDIQILDAAFFECVMHVSQLAVSGLEGPFLVRVEVAQANVIDDHIFDEGVTEWLGTYRSMQICMLISLVYF